MEIEKKYATDIGPLISNKRKIAKITQIELAEKVGVSVNSIRLYEAGKITPKADILHKIITILDFEISLKKLDESKETDLKRHKTVMDQKRLEQYNKLNDLGKGLVQDFVEMLLTYPKFCDNQEKK